MPKNYLLQPLDSKSIKEFDKEKLLGMGLEDAIIYYFDSVVADKIQKISIHFENIMEARFFNEKQEIRIFNDEGSWSGSLFQYMGKDSCRGEEPWIDEKYFLIQKNKKGDFPSQLRVRKYIHYDEDQQAYIGYVKPMKLIFKGGKAR